MGIKNKQRIRVKCANCGMIYDLLLFEGSWDGNSLENARGECPKCTSNAFDKVRQSRIS